MMGDFLSMPLVANFRCQCLSGLEFMSLEDSWPRFILHHLVGSSRASNSDFPERCCGFYTILSWSIGFTPNRKVKVKSLAEDKRPTV